MKTQLKYLSILLLSCGLSLASCSDDHNNGDEPDDPNEELSEEWYTGGKLGTSFNYSATCFEQPTPVVEDMGLIAEFKNGETLFEKKFNTNESGPYNGLGPLYIRTSCEDCHPGYGHSKRVTKYDSNEYGNGYLLVITDQNNSYVSSLTGMPQTKAVSPFKAPVNESGIHINWLSYVDEYGNTFPDGETYELIYPEVTIDRDAFYVPVPDVYNVYLEGTIGIYGTGLLDAITDEDLIAEYESQQQRGYCQGRLGSMITENDGTTHPGRYTYGQTRGTLQNGPGANAIWNITNVTHPSRRYHYMTTAYAEVASKDKDVQQALGWTEQQIYDYLMSQELDVEMSQSDYDDFMIWHRGLAVPAARDLDNTEVQRGRTLFYEMGCDVCHKPSWTTGPDNYTGDKYLVKKLPTYPYQKIWPYTDLLAHNLDMKNPGLRQWCRTTPLWGRGLMKKAAGHEDRLHDCRARNEIEAIMWHGGDAKRAVESFRQLSKSDRDAVVRFLQSI
jgi:CxxC motif-containing protein (DUF1111 family)